MFRNLLVLAAVTATFAVGEVARAQPATDDAIYVAGTACRPRKADVGKVNYNNTSAVNENSASAKVVCPIHMQKPTPQWLVPGDLMIFGIDRSTSSNISCTLYAWAGEQPGSVFQEAASTTGTSDPFTGKALQMLRGQDGALDLFGIAWNDPPWMTFTMTCTLPGASSSSTRSELVDYRVGLY